MKDSRSLNFRPEKLRYSGIIGTGGIGTGKFFVLNGNHLLGREESRSGHFLDVRDYCKQHIILHYIKVLLGPCFSVVPLGKIGNDDTGQLLFNEMKETGFETKRIEKSSDLSTLFSFCFYYPDGTGGNMTTDNSASAQVDPAYIETALPDIEKLGYRGIIMAAPEVPLSARQKLLTLGKLNGLFCSASFTNEEIRFALNAGIIENVDLIALNLDELTAIADNNIEKRDLKAVIQSGIHNLQSRNNKILVSITGGKDGSWCWNGNELKSFPAIKTEVKSTAGAGDAFFSGLLCGLALGHSLFESQQLASLIAGLSVTSPHTINKEIDRNSLKKFLDGSDLSFSENIIKLLEE